MSRPEQRCSCLTCTKLQRNHFNIFKTYVFYVLLEGTSANKILPNVEGLDFAQSSSLTSRSHLDAGIHELSHRSGGLRSNIKKKHPHVRGTRLGKKNMLPQKRGTNYARIASTYIVLGGVRQECLDLCAEMGRLFALWNRLIPCKSGSDILCFCVLCTILWTKELPKHCPSQYFCSLRLENIPQLFEAASLAMFFKVLAAELKVCIGLAGGLRTTIRGCCPVDSLAKQKIKKKIWDFGVFWV